MGFGKVKPNNVFGFDGGANRFNTRSAGSKREALQSDAIVK
jgi:hypothetical protein